MSQALTKTPSLTLGQRVADVVTASMGSWRFIILQGLFLALWIGLNTLAWDLRWDGPPFILLNLMLSFQAAFAAPFIMISQNRQNDVDRQHVVHIEELSEKHERLQEQLNMMLAHLEKLAEVDHEEHGRLIREIHSHTECTGHTEIISEAPQEKRQAV